MVPPDLPNDLWASVCAYAANITHSKPNTVKLSFNPGAVITSLKTGMTASRILYQEKFDWMPFLKTTSFFKLQQIGPDIPHRNYDLPKANRQQQPFLSEKTKIRATDLLDNLE
ncbi:hypothetical protein ACTXT7_002663 [Hymenolepis weldensis]